MAAKGKIIIQLSINEAAIAVIWFREHRVRLLLAHSVSAPGQIAEFIKKLRKFVMRKRTAADPRRVQMILSREEANWLAGVIGFSNGLAGSGLQHRGLPPEVDWLCLASSVALGKKRGRPLLRGATLDKKISRGPIHEDDRFHKRLRRRRRDEIAVQRAGGLLSKLV